MNVLKKILLVFVLALMLMPIIQLNTKYFNISLLDGFEKKDSIGLFVNFNPQNWFSDSFQKKTNTYLQNNIGFRPLMIRLYNQINYSFFKATDNSKVVIGKNDCLFEENYILDYIGQLFIGKEKADSILYKIKHLQDKLKKESNIDFVLVFEPGKASYHSEYIPEKYKTAKKSISNYKYFSKRCNEIGIRNIDLNAMFLNAKSKTPYPLYPKYGVHWSKYGMLLAMDTVARRIEKLRNISLPIYRYDSIEVSNQWLDVDFDIEKTLNLLFPIHHEKMAYPILIMNDTLAKTRPKLLMIGDSYCWSIIDNGIASYLFKDFAYWYYNKTIYPDIWKADDEVSKLNVMQEYNKYDVILIMITEANLYKAFWGVESNYRP